MKIFIIQTALIISVLSTLLILCKSIIDYKNKKRLKLQNNLYLLTMNLIIIGIIILLNFYFYLADLENVLFLSDKRSLYLAISGVYFYLKIEGVLLLINSIHLLLLKLWLNRLQ